MSLRDIILAAKDWLATTVTIPEWGITITIRFWSGQQAIDFQRFALDPDNKDLPVAHLHAKAAVLTCADEEGNLLFTDDDIPALLGKNHRVLKRLFDEAMKANGIREDAIDNQKKD